VGVHLENARPGSDGAAGDASRATAERGEKLLQLKTAAAVAEIRAARQADGAVLPAEPGGVLAWLRRLISG
jgi:creatinine amidohydrolase/Fe(II)-dependent formamide hydrolase-like protein